VAGDMSKECTPMKTKSMLFFGFGKLKGKNWCYWTQIVKNYWIQCWSYVIGCHWRSLNELPQTYHKTV
jgi:hypothetical protein